MNEHHIWRRRKRQNININSGKVNGRETRHLLKWKQEKTNKTEENRRKSKRTVICERPRSVLDEMKMLRVTHVGVWNEIRFYVKHVNRSRVTRNIYTRHLSTCTSIDSSHVFIFISSSLHFWSVYFFIVSFVSRAYRIPTLRRILTGNGLSPVFMVTI